MSSKSEKVTELFLRGYNCAQSVFAAFSEDGGLDAGTALKLTYGFGGGCGQAGTCGAITGSMLAIGLKHGSDAPDDAEAKATLNAKREKLAEDFTERFGSTLCLDLLGFDIRTDEGHAKLVALMRDLPSSPCVGFITHAASILEEME